MARLYSCAFTNQYELGWRLAPTSATFGEAGPVTASRSVKLASTGFVYMPSIGTTTITYQRFFIKLESTPTSGAILWQAGPTYGHTLNIDTSLRLVLKNGIAVCTDYSASISLGAWHLIQIADTGSASTTKLYVDGVEVPYTAGGYAYNGYPALANSASGVDIWFADYACNDGTGSYEAGLPARGHVIRLLPDGEGDGDTNCTRAGADSGSNYGQLDESEPNDATDYLNLTANNSVVWVDVEAPPADVDTVNVVHVSGRIRGASTSNTNYFGSIKSQAGGTQVNGTSRTVNITTWTTNYGPTGTVGVNGWPILTQHTDPQAGGAWTAALLASMQIGCKGTDGNPDVYLTALWAIVDYVPLPPEMPPLGQYFPRRRLLRGLMGR